MSKIPAKVEPYMDELRYWNHGDNPAFKKFAKIVMENTRGKRAIDHRTHVIDRGVRFFSQYTGLLWPEISMIFCKEISKHILLLGLS